MGLVFVSAVRLNVSGIRAHHVGSKERFDAYESIPPSQPWIGGSTWGGGRVCSGVEQGPAVHDAQRGRAMGHDLQRGYLHPPRSVNPCRADGARCDSTTSHAHRCSQKPFPRDLGGVR
jgi:hypothetical protein